MPMTSSKIIKTMQEPPKPSLMGFYNSLNSTDQAIGADILALSRKVSAEKYISLLEASLNVAKNGKVAEHKAAAAKFAGDYLRYIMYYHADVLSKKMQVDTHLRVAFNACLFDIYPSISNFEFKTFEKELKITLQRPAPVKLIQSSKMTIDSKFDLTSIKPTNIAAIEIDYVQTKFDTPNVATDKQKTQVKNESSFLNTLKRLGSAIVHEIFKEYTEKKPLKKIVPIVKLLTPKKNEQEKHVVLADTPNRFSPPTTPEAVTSSIIPGEDVSSLFSSTPEGRKFENNKSGQKYNNGAKRSVFGTKSKGATPPTIPPLKVLLSHDEIVGGNQTKVDTCLSLESSDILFDNEDKIFSLEQKGTPENATSADASPSRKYNPGMFPEQNVQPQSISITKIHSPEYTY